MQSTKTLPAVLLIVVACLAVYAQTCQHVYINYDDEHHVYHERIVDGVQVGDLAWSLQETSTNLWHPLTWLSYHLDGYFKKPSASHAINGILHGLNCLLLFWLLRSIPKFSGIALFVALVHAIHPLHVESVAWVSSRKDVLSQLMMLASCLGYVYFVRMKGSVWSSLSLIGSLSFAGLALLAKPSAVVLAPVILALDFALLPKTTMKAPLHRTWCYFILCAAMAVATMIIHQGSGNAELTVNMLWYEKIGLVCLNYVHYVGQFFHPHELSFFYRYPDSLPHGWLIVSSILVVLTVICLVRQLVLGKIKLWHVCLILFFISYAPTCGWIVVSDAVRADRYMYLPYVFLSMALADLARQGMISLAHYLGRKQVAVWAASLTSLWLLLLGVMAFQYTGHWKNNESLYGQAIKQDAKNYLAWHNLATSSLNKGEFSLAREQFRYVLELKPNYKNAHIGIAEAYSNEGFFDEAEPYYQMEIKLHPNKENHLAYTHFLFDHKRYEKCINYVGNINADSKSYYILLALCHQELKNFTVAENYYQQAMMAGKLTDELLINYTICLTHLEKYEEAKASLEQVNNRSDSRFKKIHSYLISR